jgi:hypothetical protein
MKEDEITGYDGYGAVLAFLKGAFADGPVSVAELEVMARAAILLGERQSITNAKAFKRAKRELGIRSVRDGGRASRDRRSTRRYAGDTRFIHRCRSQT